jgi:hypothetical protein
MVVNWRTDLRERRMVRSGSVRTRKQMAGNPDSIGVLEETMAEDRELKTNAWRRRA